MTIPTEAAFLKFITPFYVVIILIEIIFSHFAGKKYYTFQDTIHNVLLSSINALIDVSFRVVYLYVFYEAYQYRLIDWENIILYWIALLILQDLFFYFLHLTEHYSRFFWAVHVTHHSSEHFNLTVGFRSSVFEPLYRFIFFLPLVFMGFRGEDIILMYAFTQVYGILIHTQHIGKLGFLEYILVTPSHHRVHHASNVIYLDKNMGMVFICWDKIFGTFETEKSQVPIKFGITHPVPKNNFLYVLFHEWFAIVKDLGNRQLKWKEKFLYIFGKPGWSHDGSRKDSEQLRKEMNLKPSSFQTCEPENDKIIV